MSAGKSKSQLVITQRAPSFPKNTLCLCGEKEILACGQYNRAPRETYRRDLEKGPCDEGAADKPHGGISRGLFVCQRFADADPRRLQRRPQARQCREHAGDYQPEEYAFPGVAKVQREA